MINSSIFNKSQKLFVKMCLCDFVKVKSGKKIVNFSPKKNNPLLRSNRDDKFLNHKTKNNSYYLNFFCENKSHNNNNKALYSYYIDTILGEVC